MTLTYHCICFRPSQPSLDIARLRIRSEHTQCSAFISTACKIHSLCLSAVTSLCPVLTQRESSHCFRCKVNNTPRGHLSLSVALHVCAHVCMARLQRSKHAIDPAVSSDCRKQDEMNRVVIRKEDVELIVSNTKTMCGCALPPSPCSLLTV